MLLYYIDQNVPLLKVISKRIATAILRKKKVKNAYKTYLSGGKNATDREVYVRKLKEYRIAVKGYFMPEEKTRLNSKNSKMLWSFCRNKTKAENVNIKLVENDKR